MSAGAVAGLVIGLIVAAAVVVSVILLRRRCHSSSPAASIVMIPLDEEFSASGFDPGTI
jgi:hypothetical protein